MKHTNLIQDILRKQDGIILSKNLTKNMIPRVYLKNMVKKSELEKVGRGIYITPEIWEDEMFILQIQYSKAIFSHETALFLHDLTEVTPDVLSVTVPNAYNSKTLSRKNVRIRRVSKEHHEIGITEKETSFGRKVKVYDIERTLCDILKKKSQSDVRFI